MHRLVLRQNDWIMTKRISTTLKYFDETSLLSLSVGRAEVIHFGLCLTKKKKKKRNRAHSDDRLVTGFQHAQIMLSSYVLWSEYEMIPGLLMYLTDFGERQFIRPGPVIEIFSSLNLA